ncbi:hypothetical protein Tco_1082757 [Tanacetum coccineum]|uniref:Uncharacterized protein n=1 Tax=Tanacetum coccineum TaxID=301880 RepID=A0ABQ5I2Z0_9ASTR
MPDEFTIWYFIPFFIRIQASFSSLGPFFFFKKIKRVLCSTALSTGRPQCLNYATPTSSSSAGPSRKRSRSSATSISSTVHTVRALSLARTDLLPLHKRYKGTSAAHSYESSDEGSPETYADSDMDSRFAGFI